MVQTAPNINLFKSGQKSFVDKFIAWALTGGRLLIILTEVVALGAFLYRFSLDRRLIDLHDQIKYKQAVALQWKTNEDTFRNLQERIAVTSQVEKDEGTTVSFFQDIIKASSQDTTFTTLQITQDFVKIDAAFQSVSTLRSFVDQLKSNPKIKSVSVDKIENKTSQATIVAGITAQIKNSNQKDKKTNK